MSASIEVSVNGACSCWSILVTIIAILYILFDVNYFIRLAVTVLWGRVFGKKKNVEDITEIYGELYIYF